MGSGGAPARRTGWPDLRRASLSQQGTGSDAGGPSTSSGIRQGRSATAGTTATAWKADEGPHARCSSPGPNAVVDGEPVIRPEGVARGPRGRARCRHRPDHPPGHLGPLLTTSPATSSSTTSAPVTGRVTRRHSVRARRATASGCSQGQRHLPSRGPGLRDRGRTDPAAGLRLAGWRITPDARTPDAGRLTADMIWCPPRSSNHQRGYHPPAG
jgi:hypothetical protein